MPPSDDELIYDVVDYAREARGFAAEKTFNDLVDDRSLELILTKLVEIVGEAASQVSAERRSSLPEVPWRKITGMRHRLVHGYREVDLTIVWETVTVDVPRLLDILEPVVAAITAKATQFDTGKGPIDG